MIDACLNVIIVYKRFLFFRVLMLHKAVFSRLILGFEKEPLPEVASGTSTFLSSIVPRFCGSSRWTSAGSGAMATMLQGHALPEINKFF